MHIHILGICGTFMGGLAALAREAGHKVTGCDANVYPPMSDQLRAFGIELIDGYGTDQVALAPDLFVIGNAVSRGNPLMEDILDDGLRYTSGPQWLAEHVLEGRQVLAVAGTHGKTTTTAMLAWILEGRPRARLPGGGVPRNFGVSARLGNTHGAGGARTPFVIEADEYDTAFFDKRSKFVHYRPRTAVLNNLEFDHADIFANLAASRPSSTTWCARCLQGAAWWSTRARNRCSACWNAAAGARCSASERARRSPARCAPGASPRVDVLRGSMKIARVEWALLGEHNQMNALAAIAAAEHLGVAPAAAAAALATFENVARRLELKGEANGIRVYDDFAHHPTAMRTTIDGLRRKVGAQRILAVFEPRSNTMKQGAMKAQLPWRWRRPTWRSAIPAACRGTPPRRWRPWAGRPRCATPSARWCRPWPAWPSPATTCCA